MNKSRVNLGKAGPQRKTRKKRAVKMQGGGPAINPNIPNAPRGRPGPMPPPPIMGPGPGQGMQGMQGMAPPPIMPPGGVAGGPGGGRRPPIVKPRPPGIKKGGAVAKKKGGAVAKKKRGGSIERMASGEPIQWQKGPVGQRRKRDYMSYVAPKAARKQLKKQKAAGGPGRGATRRAGPGGKKGGSVKK